MSVKNVDLNALQTQLNKPVSRIDKLIYVGQDSNKPQIGDLRITFTAVLPPKPVSIIAQQTDSTLEPYMAPAGKPIELLSMGTQSPQQMIQQALTNNEINTWMIRLGMLIGLIVGFGLLLNPIVVLTDIVPFFGRIVSLGTGLIAFVAGLSLWAILTAVAWFAIRPLMAIALIVIIAALVFVLIKRKHKTLSTSTQ